MTPRMKRSLHFPFLLLFLIITVAAALICLAGFASEIEPPSTSASDVEAPTSALVRLAAGEAGDSDLRNEAEDLLQSNLDSFDTGGGRYRSISLWWRGPQPNGRTRSLARLRFPVGPRATSDYRALLPDFRRSLGVWIRRRRFSQQASSAAIMSQLVELIKRPVDLHYGYPDTRRPYATCAVVGNSGVLLGSGHGDVIDGHDLVIRLNNARTAGFARDVGSKTSLAFVNSNVLHLCSRRENCFCHPYGDFVPIVMYICQLAHFLDYVVCNSSFKSPLLVTDAQFDALCAKITKFYSLKRFVEETGKPPEEWSKAHDEKMFHYSSGMQAIMLALGICDQVNVFGFGKSAEAKHHYHTNQKAELDLHDYKAEYDFYRDLVVRPQVIPFLKDSNFKVPPIVFYQLDG
ncbi:sialyltransferase-like protein 1 [Typha latifolia]|uniref:sialyltransferase-like protein 1 n=1 Tax=Typha latifolia TaxID=4733 RepID=UPI003C2DD7AC